MDAKRCPYRCLDCPFADCVSKFPPEVDLDDFLQFQLDEQVRKTPAFFFVPTVSGCCSGADLNLPGAKIDAFTAWCNEHDVVPKVEADYAILRRAMIYGFTGRKLQKALYKVRHRDVFLEGKKRYKARKRSN